MTTANKRFYLVLGVIATLLIGWWAWGQFSPRPLGDRLEYVGREDYGCWIICDSAPASVFYYATDMTPEEVVAYFEKAVVELPSESEGVNLRIWLKKDDSSFLVRYYNDDDKISKFTSRSRKIISVRSQDYETAKASL